MTTSTPVKSLGTGVHEKPPFTLPGLPTAAVGIVVLLASAGGIAYGVSQRSVPLIVTPALLLLATVVFLRGLIMVSPARPRCCSSSAATPARCASPA